MKLPIACDPEGFPQFRIRLGFRKHVPMLLAFVASIPSAAQDFSLSNREFSVAVRNQDGAYEIRTNGASVLHAGVAALVNHDWTNSSQYPAHQVVSSTFHNTLGGGHQLTVTFSGLADRPILSYAVRLYDGLPFGDIIVEVRNNTPKTISVQSIRSLDAFGSHLLNLGAEEGSERVLSDGFSEGDVGVSDLGQVVKGIHRAVGSQLVYNRDSRKSLFFGAVTSDRFLTTLRLQTSEVQGTRSVTSYTIDSVGTTEIRSHEGPSSLPKEERVEVSEPVAPGATLPAERLLFSVTNDYHRQLEDYGTVIRQLGHARVSGPTLMGWWSWTSYYLNINERDVLSNARWMAQHLKSSGYNFALIDEGYGYSRGDYTRVNATRFPHGMRSVTDELSRLGLHLGLWVAPLLVEEKAWIARHHRNWLVQDRQGRPLWFYGGRQRQRLYVLDATHPEAAAYLRATYQTLVGRWGVRYIKLDFMDLTAVEGYYHRPHTTAMEAQRIALQTIRDAVGEDVLLDKDGSPMLNPVGIVDEGRVTGDSAHSFDDLKDRAVALAARYYMHRNFFINDPDAITLQGKIPAGQIEADNVPATPLSLSEAQISMTLAALSGGMLEIGDDLPTLASDDPERLALLTNPDLLQIVKTGRASTPLDLLDYPSEDLQPSVSFLREDDRQSVLAVFNWTDRRRSHTFALNSLGLVEGHSYSFCDVFNRDSTGATRVGNSIVIGNQRPHSVKVIKIVDRAHPHV